jgi:ribosomal-protein-alanine N-acetyltransferase
MKGISLRPLVSKDVDFFYVWASDPEVTKSLFWGPYTSRDEAEKFLADVAEKHPWFMAICKDGIPVGAITLDKGKGKAEIRAELGYVVARKYWKTGIASEAVGLVLKRGFTDLNIKRIDAYTDPDNIASQRVLEKNGFTQEGRLKKYLVHRGAIRDRFIYSVTVD